MSEIEKSEVERLEWRARLAREAFELQKSFEHGDSTLYARGVYITYTDPSDGLMFHVRPGGNDWGDPDPDWRVFADAVQSRLARLKKAAGLEAWE